MMDVDANWREKLISYIESKPLLYNKALRDYSNKDLKEKAWNDVFENVIPDWGDFSEESKRIKGKEIQQRWTNLRTCFQRELKEKKKGTSGQAAKKRRKYVYFDQLLFLLTTFEERETDSNLEPAQFSQAEDDTDSQRNAEQTFCPPPSSSHSSIHTPRTERAKRKSISYEQSLLDILKDKTPKHEEIDEDKNVALSIVPVLKRLPLGLKLEAKMEIMGVLHRFSRPNAQHNPQRQMYQSYPNQSGTGYSFGNDTANYQQFRPVNSTLRSSTPSMSSSFQPLNTLNDESPSLSSQSSHSPELYYE